jgi:eukaryotic-like serine/threonine-protein kinase
VDLVGSTRWIAVGCSVTRVLSTSRLAKLSSIAHMPLATGTKLGPYEILAPIGAGGMGEVYKARDTKLDRETAIKVIPANLAQDPERLARFEREAKILASLNHPNIAQIYGIEEWNGIRALVMELVPGTTLNELKPNIRRAVEIGSQICEALQAAHEKRVIHRDLKPANIKITPDGVVKVLDFGLAKSPAEQTREDTTLTFGMTAPGGAMGTPGYMSPEQMRGEEVDRRTDIWAFGCVLFELISGKRAFEGKTVPDSMSATLTREPDWTRLPSQTPVGLRKVLRRCLIKERKQRYQDIGDVRLELEESRDDFGRGTLLRPSGPVPKALRFRLILAFVAAVVIAVCLTAGVLMWSARRQTPPGTARFIRLTSDSGLTTDPAISPDGKLVAYASDRSGRGDLDLWVQQTTGGPPVRLTTNEANERQPAFSPDGSKVVFRSERENGGIYMVSALGGEAVRVAKGGFDPQFSPDGRRITFWTGAQVTASTPSKIYVVSANGGAPEEIQTGLPFSRHPIWTPDGSHLVFWGASDGFARVDWYTVGVGHAGDSSHPAVSCGWVDSVGRSRVFDVYPWGWIGQRAVFPLPSGDANDLWSIPISPRSWLVAGPMERLTAGLDSTLHPGLSATGRIVWAKVQTEINVWSLPVDANTGRSKGEWQQVTTGISPKQRPNLSRNGKRAVFNDGQAVAVTELGTGKETIIATNGYYASLTADGSKVVYARPSGSRDGLYVDNLNGEIPEKVCDGCGRPAGGWSADQQKILYDWGAPQALSLFDLRTRQNVELLRQPGRAFTQGGFSPDDRWILFLAGAGPSRQQVFIMPYREHSPVPKEDQWIAVTDGLALDSQPRWSPNGNLIYFVSNRDGFHCIWARRVDPATKRPRGEPFGIEHFHSAMRSISNIPATGLIGLGVAQDRIVVNLGISTGNIWMAEFDSPGQRDSFSPQSNRSQ